VADSATRAAVDVQVQLRTYFPTPVAVATIGASGPLNAEL
jgi:hypothetical protein